MAPSPPPTNTTSNSSSSSSNSNSMKWKKKIRKAKKLHRPELKNWEQDELYKLFPSFVQSLKNNTNEEEWNNNNSSSSSNTIDEYYHEHQSQNVHPLGQFRCFVLSSSYDNTNNHKSTNNDYYSNGHHRDQHQQQQQQNHNKHNYYYSSYNNDYDNNHHHHRNRNIIKDEEKKDGNSNDYYETYNAKKNNNHQMKQINPMNNNKNNNIPVLLDAKTLTKEEFWYQYERNEIPCIIQNIPYGYDDGKKTKHGPWPAIQKWNLCNLIHNSINSSGSSNSKGSSSNNHSNNNNNSKKEDQQEYEEIEDNDEIDVDYYTNDEYIKRIRNRKFKCGEDDDGYAVKIRFKYFLQYLQNNYDDSPLYIFDSSFERDKYAKSLLDDYIVPSYFYYDLWKDHISEQRRPPYRWVLIGPERSGSTIHIDPLATNAWNTLLHGQKRWVLFPPHVPKDIVKGRRIIKDDEDDEAIHYFMFLLPRIKRRAAKMMQKANNNRYRQKSNHNNQDDKEEIEKYRNFACYEFTQNPGETVFVPNGWWHAVLNLTDTVGVTQNYVSERNFHNVWIKTRTGRKRMAWKWLCALQVHYPHLYNQAIQMNQKDNFIMKYDPNSNGNNPKNNNNKNHNHRDNDSHNNNNTAANYVNNNKNNNSVDNDRINPEQQQQQQQQHFNNKEHRRKMQRVV